MLIFHMDGALLIFHAIKKIGHYKCPCLEKNQVYPSLNIHISPLLTPSRRVYFQLINSMNIEIRNYFINFIKNA